MNTGRTVFAQLIAHAPSHKFQECVARYQGDAHWRGFSCWDQYLAMAFAQLTYRESLRDIEACLRSVGGKIYHMGFRSKVARSTLADANERHDWRIYADSAQTLIGIARPMYARDPIGVELDGTLYALDSTTIDLCLSLFPWAKFRQHKAAVKRTLCWTRVAWQYSHVYQHHRWQSSRCQHPGTKSCPRPEPSTSSTVATLISLRKRLELDASLYQILQVLSVAPFEKTPILRALQQCDSQDDLADAGNQLILGGL